MEYQCLQVLELVPQLEELRGGEQDGVEGVDHGRGELEVLLSQQDVGHGVEDVLRIQQEAELPGGQAQNKGYGDQSLNSEALSLVTCPEEARSVLGLVWDAGSKACAGTLGLTGARARLHAHSGPAAPEPHQLCSYLRLAPAQKMDF